MFFLSACHRKIFTVTLLQRSPESSRNENVFFPRDLIGEWAVISVALDLLSNINCSVSYHGDAPWDATPLCSIK